MALTDDRPPAAAPAEGALDRQPPQDLAAEQSVLGGMMLSKDAIADVVEVLRPGDFYRPAHQAVYDCVLDLYGRGEPADAVTVSAELERRGELRRVGGAPYLHTLIATVPTAANAGYYAEIVAEKAILRRLVEAGTRIVQLGYARRRGRGRQRGGRPRAVVDLRGHRAADERGLRRPRGAAAADDGRDRRDRLPRRLVARRANRLRGPRRGHQRPAPRPDDHRGRATRYRQVDAGAGLHPVVLGEARHDQRDLLAGDEPYRDRHAHAVRRGQDPARRTCVVAA